MLEVNPVENFLGLTILLTILLTYICISFTITAFTAQINEECSSEENIVWAPALSGLLTTLVTFFFFYYLYRVIIGADKTPNQWTKNVNKAFWILLAFSVIFTVVSQFVGVDYINNCSTDSTDIQTIENMNRMQGLVWVFVVYVILGFLIVLGNLFRKKNT